MHLKWMKRSWAMMAAVALGIAGIAIPAKAQERPAPMATVDKGGAVIVSIGGQSRFQMKTKKKIKEVLVENDRVVQVLADANDPSTLILRGRTAGTSKLELTDEDGKVTTYTIIVEKDMELLRTLIRKTVPTASVEVTPIGDNGNSVILAGYAAREDDRATIAQLAEALGLRVAVNHVTVGGGGNVPHVQLDLTLARVDRTRARSRGANFIFNGNTVSAGSLLGGLATLQTGGSTAAALPGAVGIIPSPANVAAGGAANLIGGIVPSNFQMLLAVLKTEGLAKLVSAPTIVARSGEQAELLVGGRVPVISASSGITGPGISYERVGTELTFLPIVYGNGKIHLSIAPTVRNVSTTQALTTTFGTSPAFDEQSMRTSIICEPGQTVAIGGLIQTNTQGSVTKIPVIGDLPYIGPLFSYATQTDQEIELVILVTPRLIDPADASQMPKPLPGSETRRPDDFEFYLETMLEAPRGQRQIWDGHKYKPAWMSSPTAATYPCAGGKCGPTGEPATTTCPDGSCQTPVITGTVNTPAPVNALPVVNPAPLPSLKSPTTLPPVSDATSPLDVPISPLPIPGKVTVSEPVEPAPVNSAAVLAPSSAPGRTVATSPVK